MQKGYSPISIYLHWIMLALLIGAYASIELRVVLERGSDARALIKVVHYMFGFSIFALVWWRLIARIRTASFEREKYGKFQEVVSKLMFIALYVLMIAMPILGYVLISAEGKDIAVLGMNLPLLDIQNEDLAHQVEEIHETFGKVGYFLIGFHALAGLFHHFIVKDDTLKRML
ncbi:cytochrome b [Glaciecola sp. MF2-115]|uniref:cytochrome b n=1 Tax=Glaciecola sp. MF2-115 TaxID=3384827 RepID=UPI0039A1DCE8